jgi:hypothetical protein
MLPVNSLRGKHPMAASRYLPEIGRKLGRMNLSLFESFCDMLDSIPIKAVLRAADAERRMVEDDLEKKRTESDEYVTSVLSFCNFLTLAVRGIYAYLPGLPVEHCAFYRTVVQRLVEAGELPFELKKHFDAIFCAALSKALMTNNGQSLETTAKNNFT